MHYDRFDHKAIETISLCINHHKHKHTLHPSKKLALLSFVHVTFGSITAPDKNIEHS
jgi:hypothetical protein